MAYEYEIQVRPLSDATDFSISWSCLAPRGLTAQYLKEKHSILN